MRRGHSNERSGVERSEDRGRTDQQKIDMPCLNWVVNKINGKYNP